MNAIDVKGLHKEIGNFEIRDLSLDIPRGYITGLVGDNGAGKSTLINHLIGLLKADRGDVTILGSDDIERDREDLLNRIGLVFAEDNFPEHLSPAKLEKLLTVYFEAWDSTVYHKYLDDFNVPENTRIKRLSTGEKVKLSLAVALSHNAELLILDEPTSNLAPTFRMELLDILQELMIDGEITILFSTHITSDLERIADYIVMIDNGEILFNMEKEALLTAYKKVKGPKDILDDETGELLMGIRENSLGFEAMSNAPDTLRELFGDKVIIERLSVDEVMYFTKNNRRGV
ncbi:ABC transporter ATP-binding protein [Salinicoccus carnicancri]|uniref:ABC transporter ATP-binding protein n=1 Tax=Salinicoccus carnicancri TaxID=558170 RepID=UPI0002F48965|nr:ABC transporter ATP-binding protein [Salinicoccus carnicancri]